MIRELSHCALLLNIFKIVVDFIWINSAAKVLHRVFFIIVERRVTIVKRGLIVKRLLVVISIIVNFDDLILSKRVIIWNKGSLLLAHDLFFSISLSFFFLLSHLIDRISHRPTECQYQNEVQNKTRHDNELLNDWSCRSPQHNYKRPSHYHARDSHKEHFHDLYVVFRLILLLYWVFVINRKLAPLIHGRKLIFF